jgi:hypothetical protein
LSSHVCECGKVCGNAGGLASHRRACIEAIEADTLGRTGQLSMIPPPVHDHRGFVEAAAARDVAYLDETDNLEDGSEALQATYVLLGREIDRAEHEQDRYGKINAAAKLLTIRKDLAPVGPASNAASLDDFFAELSASVRDGEEP